MTETNQIFVYRIDENNKIIYVSDNWTQFAKDNNASEEVLSPKVLGKSLFDFITDKESRHIYQIIIDSVRSKKTDVTIPINCDSPDLRRFLEITIKRLPNNHIEFISKILHVHERDSCNILDKGTERCEEAVRICSFCKKIPVEEGSWVETECAVIMLKLFKDSKLPVLTHGVCPSCFEVALAEIQD